jgi:hypothetical protein
MDRQTRTGVTVVVIELRDDSKEPSTAAVAGGRRGKDDRKQNTLTPLGKTNKCCQANHELCAV